jgi:hypothetical protein
MPKPENVLVYKYQAKFYVYVQQLNMKRLDFDNPNIFIHELNWNVSRVR